MRSTRVLCGHEGFGVPGVDCRASIVVCVNHAGGDQLGLLCREPASADHRTANQPTKRYQMANTARS